jgi:hypothetical protein
MYPEFAIKELYEVSFKATNSMRVLGQDFEENETVMFFENLQLGLINGTFSSVEAKGGKGNPSLVAWENIQGITFDFERGTLDKMGFHLISHSQYSDLTNLQIPVPIRETAISGLTGDVHLNNTVAITKEIFVYELTSGVITRKIVGFTTASSILHLGAENASKSVLIDYYYNVSGGQMFSVNQDGFLGFFKMVGKTYYVDETGIKYSLLVVMPKVKLVSSINLLLGAKANPVVTTFRATAFPDVDNKTVARFIFLPDDIEG